MIKSIRIQNFEAHEDTTVHFTDGLQLLVGRSNSGKSSLLRALRMVVNNDWDKNMVRMGYEYCRVRVETERGWVEAERGEKINNWRCQENGGEIQVYQKVGTTVPELATKILGMGERERGAGIKELPNFQTQLEKHYMLSEIGDKKASSNMIAVMMDNAIGLGGMEDLIKDLSADLLKDKKWLNEKQVEIVDLKTNILDKAIFENYESLVNKIDLLNDEYNQMDVDIKKADEYNDKYNEAFNNKKASLALLKIMPDVNSLESQCNDYNELNKQYDLTNKAFEIFNKLDSLKNVLEINDIELNEACADCESKIKLGEIYAKCVQDEQKLESICQCDSIDVDKMNEILADVESMSSRIASAEQSLTNARDIWKQMDSAKKEFSKISKEQKDSEQEFEELKDALGVCPLCGKSFK